MEKRFQEQRILLRIVFEVRVLDDDHVPCGSGDSRAQGSALALITIMVNDFRNKRCDFIRQHVPGAVRGTVVDHDDLFVLNGR